MSVSQEDFENMIRWNLPGVTLVEVIENCQVYKWFAIFRYLGQDGEAAFLDREFIFHYGTEPHTYVKTRL